MDFFQGGERPRERRRLGLEAADLFSLPDEEYLPDWTSPDMVLDMNNGMRAR